MASSGIARWQVMRKGPVRVTALFFAMTLWTATGHAATPGDVTGDGFTNIADALLTLRYVVGLVPHTPETDALYLAACDVAPLDTATRLPKGDGKVDIADALGILRHAVNLDTWKLSALPLAPLNVATSGLTPGGSVVVTFSNAAGFLVKKNALRVNPDGTVLTGVPLYIDPVTRKVTTGTVNIAVTQILPDATQVPLNSPLSCTIEDLPTLAGIPSGQITRSFFTSSALTSSLRISALQFFETNLKGKIVTSAARDSEMTLLQSFIKARNSIDSLIKDPSTVIAMGNAGDGAPLQFTGESLALTDRMIAAWLSGLPWGTPPLTSLTAASIVRASQLDIDQVNTISQQLATLIGLKSDIDILQSNSSTTTDNALAFSDALGSLAGSDALSAATANAAVLNAAQHYLTDWSQVVSDAVNCLGAPGSCASLLTDADTLLKNGAGQFLSTYIQSGLSNLNVVSGGTLTGPLALGAAVLNYATTGNPTQVNQDIYNNIPSLGYGGLFLTGVVRDSGTQSGLDMIVPATALCADDPIPISGLTDANGGYFLSIPANPYCATASTLNIQASDPLTGVVYGSEVVDLQGVGTSKLVTVPPISYSPPSPADVCCACNFDVYCTVFGPGGCWICHESTEIEGVCQAPYGYLTSPGACNCDPAAYQICQ